MKSFYEVSSGFTLIELLVVTGIMAVLTAVGVASYNQFNDKQKVDQAARELVSNLKKAQSNAAVGRKDSCSQSLEGWYADLSARTYYGQCSGGTKFPNPPLSLITGNFSLTSTPPASVIKFEPLTGETSSNLIITVSTDPAGTIKKKVAVTPKGVIELVP